MSTVYHSRVYPNRLIALASERCILRGQETLGRAVKVKRPRNMCDGQHKSEEDAVMVEREKKREDRYQ